MLVANPLNPTCVHPLLDSTHEHTLFWLAEPPFPLALHRRVALFLACTTVTSALPGIKNGNAELSPSAPSSQPPPVCNGPCYAAHTTSWSIKCVPGYLHGCHGCPECQSPPSTPPFPPLTPGGALLTEVDVVLTVRNITAKAFNGDGTGVDYRTLLTERYFVPLLGLQPNATWSNPIDGQREANVTFGPAKDLPSTGTPKTVLEASIRVVGSASAGDAVVASVERIINKTVERAMDNTKYPANLWPAVTLVSIDPPTISVRPLAAPSPPPPMPPSPAAPGVLSLSVRAVNGVEGRASPEPYKNTSLCAFTGCTLVSGESFNWTIEFMPWPDELVPPYTPNVPTATYATGEASSLVHEFTRPGYYTVSVISKTHGATYRTFNNVYARREVRNLTASEWGLYVDALWTLMNVSTPDGRKRFTCPSGRQEDYHTHAFFVALHGAASANNTCDQFHFSLMQEFAHLGGAT